MHPFLRTDCDSLDYQETAVRLEKEWNVEDPQKLPFAPHVTSHALVAVLNRGLLYNTIERESARVCNRTIVLGLILKISVQADESRRPPTMLSDPCLDFLDL
jgi:hypothetical protein